MTRARTSPGHYAQSCSNPVRGAGETPLLIRLSVSAERFREFHSGHGRNTRCDAHTHPHPSLTGSGQPRAIHLLPIANHGPTTGHDTSHAHGPLVLIHCGPSGSSGFVPIVLRVAQTVPDAQLRRLRRQPNCPRDCPGPATIGDERDIRDNSQGGVPYRVMRGIRDMIRPGSKWVVRRRGRVRRDTPPGHLGGESAPTSGRAGTSPASPGSPDIGGMPAERIAEPELIHTLAWPRPTASRHHPVDSASAAGL